jgi:hypothetical protein
VEQGVTSPLRRFFVLREKDPSGVAGTGRILEGVVFPCGKVVLKWRLPLSSLVVFEDFKSFCEIYLHAHPTCNKLVWADPENPPSD